MSPSMTLRAASTGIAVALLLVACTRAPESETADETTGVSASRLLELDPEMFRTANLEFAEAGKGRLREMIPCYGEIAVDPSRRAPILPRIEGVVVDLEKQLGDAVEAGELLVIVESGALATAIIDYLQSEEDLDFAREELEREEQLFEKKLSSAEVHQAKRQALRKAQIAHAAALQPLNLLHYSEEMLHEFAEAPEDANLTRLEIRSPLAGVVTHCGAHRGEPVSADTEVLRVTDLSEVWVDFHVPLDAAGGLKAGDRVTVTNTFEGTPGEATVLFVSPLAEETSRRVAVRATLPNGAGSWRPGTPVTVEVLANEQEVELSIPSAAVLDHQGGFLVFVRKGEHGFEPRTVTVGYRDEELVEVTHGLSAGEVVATTNAFQLKAEWLIRAE